MNNLSSKTPTPPPVKREALDLLDDGLIDLDRMRLEAAKAKFEAAIALEPEFAVAYFYLGSVLFEEDLFVQALAAFEKALAIDPGNDDLESLISNIKDLSAND